MTQEMNARLIEQYRDAVKARARLRRILLATSLTSFIVFGLLLWQSGHLFATSGIASVHRELTDHLRANSDQYTSSLSNVAGGVFAAYKKAAFAQAKTDLPKLEGAAQKQLDELNKFTQVRWKDYEKELDAMMSEQEQIIREELTKITTEERAKSIAANYGVEIDSRLSGFVKTAFGAHLRVGEEIAQNMARISELEPDIQQPPPVNHAIGLALELAGLEFQSFEND